MKRKISTTILMVLLVRLIAHIPVPWTDTDMLESNVDLGLKFFSNLFSGGALTKFTMGAVGISTYISCTIVFQLVMLISPQVKRAYHTPGGNIVIRRALIGFGVLLSVPISIIATYTMNSTYDILLDDVWYVYCIIAIIQATGSAIAIYAGEKIEHEGIGMGMSMLIYSNILASLPSTLSLLKTSLFVGDNQVSHVVIYAAVSVFIVALIVVTQQIELKIPVIKASQGQKFGSMSVGKIELPMKLNFAGIMPIVFSVYCIQGFSMIATFIGNFQLITVAEYIEDNIMINTLVTITLLILFTLLFSALSCDFPTMSNEMQASGLMIYGVTPGTPTIKFLRSCHRDLLGYSMLVLIFVCVVPNIIFNCIDVTVLPSVSIIILTSISLDIWRYIFSSFLLFRKNVLLYRKDKFCVVESD